MTMRLIERLTKSGNSLVNTMFEVGLIGTLAGGAFRVAQALRKQSGLTDAIGITFTGLALWRATPGLFRLWKN
jgi:hypothetical protein